MVCVLNIFMYVYISVCIIFICSCCTWCL